METKKKSKKKLSANTETFLACAAARAQSPLSVMEKSSVPEAPKKKHKTRIVEIPDPVKLFSDEV